MPGNNIKNIRQELLLMDDKESRAYIGGRGCLTEN
jgi:hypothetical protein